MTLPPLSIAALACLLVTASAQSVFINELHYDNSSSDLNEGVEIAGPAGTDLSSYELIFYNGSNGEPYGVLPLGGTLPSQGGTAFGTAFFPRAPIQNGAPDGIALVDTVASSVIQFLSYEGTFTASGGAAAGETSTDIGVSESGATPASHSLQLTGSGAVYSDFTWQAPQPASSGNINPGQTFLGAGNPAITLTLMPSTLEEGNAANATLALSPPPANSVRISIANSAPNDLSAPHFVDVPAAGSTSFPITAIDDGLNDGTKTVTLAASDPEGLYDPSSATALVQDIQRPVRGTAIRLASINTLNGVGSRNTPEYDATISLLERIEPDIVCFQEVSSTGNFFDLRQLAADLGLDYLATGGDAFAGQPYEGGRFSSDQNIAIASRFPITSTTQIERDRPDRREVTRFPLMVEVDVPGTDNDPVIVGVHYKATTEDASRYRRAVEAYRTREAIAAAGHDPDTDNVFVLGDFNEDNDRPMPGSYDTGVTTFPDGSRLPASYQLGSDLAGENARPIPYGPFPDAPFGLLGMITPDHTQQDGRSRRTFITFGDAALDYILHSGRIAANGNTPSEIYNSSLDLAFDGLLKQAAPPAPASSFVASDHFALFGDYELDPKPALSLTVLPAAVSEGDGAGAATGTIRLPAPPDSPVEINLELLRPDAPLSLPSQPITFAAGETSKTFPIDILYRPTADPDRSISIRASAEGYSPDNDSLQVFNVHPSGRVLISQYAEPPVGSTPRGIEIFSCGSHPIDLRGEPVRIAQFNNGAQTGTTEVVAQLGILPAGGVAVIGDATVGAYLVSQGLLTNPDPPVAAAPNGTHYLNGAGELIYVKDSFSYNGNDALEVSLAFGLSDVFGTIGQDPGNAWSSGGVSTSGRNLALLDDVATPSAGFDQPHRRFTDLGPGSDLSGFGLPPAASDPVKIWMQSFGLGDLGADPDGDGLPNLVELATGSIPVDPASANAPALAAASYSFRRLSTPGRLRYQIEVSDDLSSWIPASLDQTGSIDHGDGTETVSFALPVGLRSFLRLKVTLD